MKEKIMDRRRLLTSLGLLAGAAYATPFILNISEARASSCSGGGGGSGPSAASAPSAASTPSTASGPSGAESGPSSQTCTDVLGTSVRCNPT